MALQGGAMPSPAESINRTLLIVDDEAAVRRGLYRMLRPEGYEILTASDGKEGLRHLETIEPGVILSDLKMPHKDGRAFLEEARRRRPDTVRLLLTAYADLNGTLAGERILGRQSCYRLARQIARHHHERWDGGGYPDGLRGESIPLPARIVAVADVFDALTHARPDKPAWPIERALSTMNAERDRAFDPGVRDAFLVSGSVTRADSPKERLHG